MLHAITSVNEVKQDITIPTSRTLSKKKEKEVVDEINVHAKAQELAKKILDYKKQRRSLDRSVRKIEKELEVIFDQAGSDTLEIEMGLLTRRKKGDGYEWLIEI